MRLTKLWLSGLIPLLVCISQTAALETDPFWSWGKPLPDVTDKLNAWVMVRLEDELKRANLKPKPQSCQSIRRTTIHRMRTLLIHDLEAWISNTDWIEKQPHGMAAEQSYREEYLLAGTHPFDTAKWLPPAPTIRVNGVRIGVDKLSHFFSEGWLYYRWSKRYRKRGWDETKIERKVVERGMKWELTILGKTSSGIFSVADAEANHAGYLFWRDFCDDEHPMIISNGNQWVVNYRFDFRRYVSPGWDESWQPNIYSSSRWERVEPRLSQYCEQLLTPGIATERKDYASRDSYSLTEQVVEQFYEDGKFGRGRGVPIQEVCKRSSFD